MLAWQQLYYVGPEIWMLSPFMECQDDHCGPINLALPNVTAWRKLVAHLNSGYSA